MENNHKWTIVAEDGSFQKIQNLESGLYGLLYNGNFLTDPSWFEVTRFPKYWYLRKNQEERIYYVDSDRYDKSTGGRENEDETQDDGSIVTYDQTTGKYGYVDKNGQRLLENVFDEIFKWDDCDVVYTRNGREIKYYNTAGIQILTHIRNIPDANDYRYPYYTGEPQTNIIQTMDLSQHPIGDDFCYCHGIHTGLSRRTRTEHMAYLERVANVKRISREAKRAFKSKYTYIFASFVVQSTPNSIHPIYDCLKQLWDFEEFESTWQWQFVIVLPQKPTIQQKREADWLVECIMTSGDLSTAHTIAYGVDESLKEGAIVYATRFFWDDGGRFLNSRIEIGGLTVHEVKELIEARGFNQRDLNNALFDLVRDADEWYTFKKLSEWLVKNGAIFRKNILLDIWIHTEANKVVELIKWLLSPLNAHMQIDVNSVIIGRTFLDKINRWNPDDVNAKQELIDLLISHGAKTCRELREEQALNFGYPNAVFTHDV